MKIHQKKIALQWYELRLKGLKDWEIRKNDCDYQVGDYMVLKEYDENQYTGREMVVIITNVANDVPYLPDDVVVLSTKEVALSERLMVYREVANGRNME